GHPKLVSFEVHHGVCFTLTPDRSYIGGHVSHVDVVNIDEFCLHVLKEMMVQLELTKHVKDNKIILMDVEHGSTNVCYANTGNEIIVHVDNSLTIDCDRVFETDVGPVGNFKEVKGDRENEIEEESEKSETEENDAISSEADDLEELDYDPKDDKRV
ncbi:hypothetical protein Tco_0690774, partial [Tanacetum coccineum]